MKIKDIASTIDDIPKFDNGIEFMKTIKAYGYEVTGMGDIIAEIEEDMKNPDIKIEWINFNCNDEFYSKDGNNVYSVLINHDNKRVLLELKRYTILYV